MDYLTTFYRRREEGGCSLLLQQYLCRRTPVCFGCLCTAESGADERKCGELAERLLLWCRGVPWHRAAGRPGPWLGRLGGELVDLMETPANAGKPGEIRYTLLLGIGEEILVLGGGQCLSLLSTSFGRGKLIGLPGQFRGRLEPGAGLLLATEGFMKNAKKRGMEEALQVWEMGTEKQAERHLRELGSAKKDENSEKGIPGEVSARNVPAAAILLLGREGESCGRG